MNHNNVLNDVDEAILQYSNRKQEPPLSELEYTELIDRTQYFRVLCGLMEVYENHIASRAAPTNVRRQTLVFEFLEARDILNQLEVELELRDRLSQLGDDSKFVALRLCC